MRALGEKHGHMRNEFSYVSAEIEEIIYPQLVNVVQPQVEQNITDAHHPNPT